MSLRIGHHSECPQKTIANIAMMTNQANALELARNADKTLMMFLPSIDVND